VSIPGLSISGKGEGGPSGFRNAGRCRAPIHPRSRNRWRSRALISDHMTGCLGVLAAPAPKRIITEKDAERAGLVDNQDSNRHRSITSRSPFDVERWSDPRRG
jgi:hypothetical protein